MPFVLNATSAAISNTTLSRSTLRTIKLLLPRVMDQKSMWTTLCCTLRLRWDPWIFSRARPLPTVQDGSPSIKVPCSTLSQSTPISLLLETAHPCPHLKLPRRLLHKLPSLPKISSLSWTQARLATQDMMATPAVRCVASILVSVSGLTYF